jgi:hypothetical protein
VRTGKVRLRNETERVKQALSYRDIYFQIPCVPEDFDSVTSAAKHCSSGGSVVLLPGFHENRICIDKSITIQAAHPGTGTVLGWFRGVNEPVVDIENLTIGATTVDVTLKNIQIVHSTNGMNIWNGQCAISVKGNAVLKMEGCSVQSDSGRGVVVTKGSSFHMSDTVCHDCAATGVYGGDPGTVVTARRSNIIRNGGGSSRLSRQRYDITEALERNMSSISVDYMPPGHSGFYIENSKCVIEDCLIAGNSDSGISVVRGASLQISDCDITENLGGALKNQDYFGTGRITETPLPSNFVSFSQSHALRRGGLEPIADNRSGLYGSRLIALGGHVRESPFDHLVHYDKAKPLQRNLAH